MTVDLRLHSGAVAGQAIGGPGDRTCLGVAVGTAVRTGRRTASPPAPVVVRMLATPAR